MSEKPSLTLVRVGPNGLTLEQTLALFKKLSGRDATTEEITELQVKMEARTTGAVGGSPSVREDRA